MQESHWSKLERLLIGLLGALAMLVGIVQVLGRYIAPSYAISWAEEVIVYLIVWGVMIASSQLVRTDGLVRPDLVLRALPSKLQRWTEVLNCLAALVFSGGLVWYGFIITRSSWLLDEHSSTGLEFPMWLYYAALPAGGLLMMARYLIRLYRFVFAFDPASMTVGHIPSHEMPGDADMLPPRP